MICSFTTGTLGATGRVFVTNERSDSVSVIDAATNKVVGTIAIGKRARGIGLAPDRNEAYVAISGDDPETFAVRNNGNIYISNEEDAKASVFNPKTGELVAEIEAGIEPEGVAISPDGTRAIVTSESSNMLHVIAIPQHEIVHNIVVGARPRAATFSTDSKTAHATIGNQWRDQENRRPDRDDHRQDAVER